MPYAIGLHPGFRWPAERARIVFDQAENPDVPVITERGLFSRERRPVPLADGRTLLLSRELMAREALCFLGTRSRRFVYEADGFGRLQIEHDDLPHLALWSRPPALYLCIESWTGHGDPEDFSGDLADKPSMRMLAPGANARHAVRYAWSDLPIDAWL